MSQAITLTFLMDGINVSSFTNFNAQRDSVRYFTASSGATPGKEYRLIKNGFRYYLKDSHSTIITVPSSFKYNKLSIPRCASSSFSLTGRYAASLALYSYLITVGMMRKPNGRFAYCKSRSQARAIFLESLRVAGMGPIECFLIRLCLIHSDFGKCDKLR